MSARATGGIARGGAPGTGGHMAGMVAARPRNTWKTIFRLLSYMKRSGWLILLVAAVVVAGSLMQVVSPKWLGRATTVVFEGARQPGGIDFARVKAILFGVALLYLGSSVAAFLQQWLMTLVSQRTTYVLRNELKAKMNRVPVSFFDKHSNGNLMSIAVNDMDNIANTMQMTLTQLISSLVRVVGIIALMLTISWQLTLITSLMLPCGYGLIRFITPRAQRNYRRYLNLQGDLNGHIEETFNGHNLIKSFNRGADAMRTFEGVNDGMFESGWKARFYGGSTMPGMMVIRNINYVMLAVAGAIQVAAGRVPIGDLQAFLQYSMQFSQPISHFAQIWNDLLSAVASAERVFRVFDAEEPPAYPVPFPDRPGKAAQVAFEHVQFGYGEKLLMTDFNLDVRRGEMVAIVGKTGAGKTTLISLLERFYEIRGGGIRLDGVDIRNMDVHALRGRMGMVLQDTWLFSGTIYDNIRYGNEAATHEQILAAARAAYVDDFVHSMSDGYQTLLNEDAGNISQGQRQLITIARAFVSDPDILILDEATSNVDSRTEMLVQKAMKRLLKGRTSFVVAHRLSTIYDADNIIVMKRGNIVETGTHTGLLARNGVYADIYNSQFAPTDV